MGGSKKCDVTREKINIFYFFLLNADTKNKHELNQVQHGFDMLFFKVKAMIPRFPSRWLGNCCETTKVAETISSVLVYWRRRFDAFLLTVSSHDIKFVSFYILNYKDE